MLTDLDVKRQWAEYGLSLLFIMQRFVVFKGGTTSLMAKERVPMPCRLVLWLSSAGEGQRRGLGEPEATTQLESVSAEKLTEYLHVWSMQRLWDMCEAMLFTCIYLFSWIKLHGASLHPRPPLLFLGSLQKYLKAFRVSSPLPVISLVEHCWPDLCCDLVSVLRWTGLLGLVRRH